MRLDRAFYNDDWDQIFPNHILQGTPAGISDHCPLILALCGLSTGRRRFHFESFWSRMEGFQEIVDQARNTEATGYVSFGQIGEQVQSDEPCTPILGPKKGGES